MIEPMREQGEGVAVIYNVYKDIDGVVAALLNALYGEKAENYDRDYVDRAATKFYAYDGFVSYYDGKCYLTREDLEKVKASGMMAVDKHQISDNLNNFEGYTQSTSVYMNFGRYAKYVDIGDINYLSSGKQPFTYFLLDRQAQQQMYDVSEIRLPRVPRHLAVMETVARTGNAGENAKCILGLEATYTRFYTHIYKNIYYPFKSRIGMLSKGKCSAHDVMSRNFITPERFLEMVSGRVMTEVRVRAPMWTDLPGDEKFQNAHPIRVFDEQIDYMDMFNGISLMEDWWVMTRDFYCNPDNTGKEYVDNLLRFNPNIEKLSLLQSGMTFTISQYDPKKPEEYKQPSSGQTSAFNICWWVFEWQKQARKIAQEYDLMFHSAKNQTGYAPLSAFSCMQMLAQAKYRAFMDYYKEGDYILTTVMPYENILEVDTSRIRNEAYSGNKLSQYDLLASKHALAPLRQMLEGRGYFSLISARSLVTARILKIYQKEVGSEGNRSMAYLCNLEINYYSEGKKYESTAITIDIDKWYTLPFTETVVNMGVDYRVDTSIINPTYVLRHRIQGYCERNSSAVSELRISPETAAQNAFVMSLIQRKQLDGGVKSFYSPRVGVTKREIVDVHGKRPAYMPDAQLYGTFMDLCEHAFKSPFAVHTFNEVHFNQYLYNESDIINQGLRFRFQVNKHRQEESI